MKINKKVGEIIGWYGTIAIMTAYALVSFNIISSQSWVFPLLNFSGAIGIIVISIIKDVRQSVILNIFWAIIALFAIINLILK